MSPKNKKPGRHDHCQTPPYATAYLLKHITIPPGPIWEPAAGMGYLAKHLRDAGHTVIATDLHPHPEPLTEIATPHNFFAFSPKEMGSIITNPPFSIKTQWLKRCYELSVPFALLMPITYLSTQGGFMLMKHHGIEVLVPDKRIHYIMPTLINPVGAQFSSCWYTHGLGLGTPLKFARINRGNDSGFHRANALQPSPKQSALPLE